MRKGQWRLASTLCGDDRTFRSLLVDELLKAGGYTEANTLNEEWGLPPIDVPTDSADGGGSGGGSGSWASGAQSHCLSLADTHPTWTVTNTRAVVVVDSLDALQRAAKALLPHDHQRINVDAGAGSTADGSGDSDAWHMVHAIGLDAEWRASRWVSKGTGKGNDEAQGKGPPGAESCDRDGGEGSGGSDGDIDHALEHTAKHMRTQHDSGGASSGGGDGGGRCGGGDGDGEVEDPMQIEPTDTHEGAAIVAMAGAASLATSAGPAATSTTLTSSKKNSLFRSGKQRRKRHEAGLGPENKTFAALLQVANHESVWLFDLPALLTGPEAATAQAFDGLFVELFDSPRIVKLGFGFGQDLKVRMALRLIKTCVATFTPKQDASIRDELAA